METNNYVNRAMEAAEFDRQKLLDKNQPASVQLEAVRAILSKLSPSGIAMILPTQGVPETTKLFEQAQTQLDVTSQTFRKYIDSTQTKDNAQAKAEALQVVNFVDTLLEVGNEMGKETATIKIDEDGNPVDDRPDLDDGLEDGDDPNIRVSTAVRGPFIQFPSFGLCKEQAFPLEIECGGCGEVIKEFRGLQLRLVLRRITKVIEPWFSRRRIIHRWVWVLEWVPVQMIKIIWTKCCDSKDVHITKRVVLDRGLINFWRCY